MAQITIPLGNRKMNKGRSFASCTDVGCVREHNEDALFAAPPLFAVADGMGGHEAGEVASAIAIKTLTEHAPTTLDVDALGHAVELANYAILKGVQEGVGAPGMGTTLTAAMLQGERLLIAQVGDSRAYLLHGDTLQQITRDHSLVAELVEAGQITEAEARIHPQRSVITRALGSTPNTHPDLYELNVSTGDRILLCSDGLSGMVEDSEIEAIMKSCRHTDECAQKLVDQALLHGGYDNVSVVVFDVEPDKASVSKREKKSRRNVFALAGVTLLVLFAALFGSYNWLTNGAYLTAQDGYVTIYKGTNGELFGHSLSEFVEQTDIPVEYLNAGLVLRLEDEGVRADSLEDAYELAETYRADAARNEQIAQNGSTDEPA